MNPYGALSAQNETPNVHFHCKNQRIFTDFENTQFSFLAPLEPPPWSLLGALGSLEAPFGLSLVHLGTPWAALRVILGCSWAPVCTNCRTFAFLGRPWALPRLHLDHLWLPGVNFGPPIDNSGALLVSILNNFSYEIK